MSSVRKAFRVFLARFVRQARLGQFDLKRVRAIRGEYLFSYTVFWRRGVNAPPSLKETLLSSGNLKCTFHFYI